MVLCRVVVAWRVYGETATFPQVSLVAEATVRHVQRSKEGGDAEEATGGTVLFLSPGVKASFSNGLAATMGIQVPVVQNLNGDQLETDFRFVSGLSFTF